MTAEQYIDSVKGQLHPRELGNYDVASYKRERVAPAYSYTPKQAKAIHDYSETAYEDINQAARSGRDPGPVADTISSAMQPLPDDLILLRELNGADSLSDRQPGDILTDPGFASTTLAPRGRYASGRAGSTVLHILAPKGTPAVYADPASGFPEDEMILDRNTPMMIMRSQARPGQEGYVQDVYLLALPKGVTA